MIKRFLLLSIFSLAFASVGFSNEIKTENVDSNTLSLLENHGCSELYENDKWDFLGTKFIDEFDDCFVERKAITNLRSVRELSFFCCLFLLGLSFVAAKEPQGIVFISIPTTFLAFMIIITNIYGYIYINDEVKRRNFCILKNFLNRWRSYKEFTPEQLHLFFDALYKQKDSLSDYCDIEKTIKTIQRQVRRNDIKYYQYELVEELLQSLNCVI